MFMFLGYSTEYLLAESLGSHGLVLHALGWHLEKIHVTWAHLGKKQTRLQLYTKVDEEIAIQWLDTASQLFVTMSEHQRDDVSKFETALERYRLKEALEDSITPQNGAWTEYMSESVTS
ncbi:hypothetical protein Tco_1426675 [Tanacetum coccineum]